jgi:hypothetical protein
VLARAAVADGVYRWQDEHGNTVFSQRPPPGAVAEKVKPLGGKAASDSSKQLESARQQFAPPVPPKQPEKPELTQEQVARKAGACEQARHALKLLEQNNRPRYVDESGKTAFMSESIKAERTADAEQKISEYCR